MVKARILGTLPKAVGVLDGEIKVILSPTPTRSFCASREPTTIEGPPEKLSSDPATILLGIIPRAINAGARMPRTSAPLAAPLTMAIT